MVWPACLHSFAPAVPVPATRSSLSLTHPSILRGQLPCRLHRLTFPKHHTKGTSPLCWGSLGCPSSARSTLSLGSVLLEADPTGPIKGPLHPSGLVTGSSRRSEKEGRKVGGLSLILAPDGGFRLLSGDPSPHGPSTQLCPCRAQGG